jgi:hypothetical protein
MLPLLIALVSIAFLVWGAAQFVRARRARQSVRRAVLTLIAAPVVFTAGALAWDQTLTPDERAALNARAAEPTQAEPAPEPAAAPVAEEPAPVDPAPQAQEPAPQATAPAPEPEPVTPLPAEPTSTQETRTGAQNLAIIAGRSPDDTEITEQYARLEASCPAEATSPADVVVNLQTLVREKSGRELEITDIMEELLIAQSEGDGLGLKCTETAGLLATLMIGGL